jgi:signal transduction histidine kinase
LHTREEFSGTGIGLALCKKIAENHNGFITAYGEPGTGATITVYLPNENLQ